MYMHYVLRFKCIYIISASYSHRPFLSYFSFNYSDVTKSIHWECWLGEGGRAPGKVIRCLQLTRILSFQLHKLHHFFPND